MQARRIGSSAVVEGERGDGGGGFDLEAAEVVVEDRLVEAFERDFGLGLVCLGVQDLVSFKLCTKSTSERRRKEIRKRYARLLPRRSRIRTRDGPSCGVLVSSMYENVD